MNVYEDHRLENKNLPFIFNETKALPIHSTISSCNWHENVEILFITDGSGIVRIEDVELPVKEGDLAIINANHIHDIYSKEYMRYACLIVDRTFFLQNGVDSNDLHFRSVLRDDGLYALLKDNTSIGLGLACADGHTGPAGLFIELGTFDGANAFLAVAVAFNSSDDVVPSLGAVHGNAGISIGYHV